MVDAVNPSYSSASRTWNSKAMRTWTNSIITKRYQKSVKRFGLWQPKLVSLRDKEQQREIQEFQRSPSWLRRHLIQLTDGSFSDRCGGANDEKARLLGRQFDILLTSQHEGHNAATVSMSLHKPANRR